MTQFSKAYLLVPVIYIGVIFGLLFLQFSGGERFSRSVGSLTLRATRTTTSEEGEPAIRAVSLEFDGVDFEFDEESGLILESASDVVDVYASDYEVVDQGFRVVFENQMILEFLNLESPQKELQIRLLAPEGTGNVREISIPFRLADGLSVLDTGNGSFVSVTGNPTSPDGATPGSGPAGAASYYFTAPPRARVDVENGKVVLESAAVGQAFRYVEASEGDPALVSAWFEAPELQITDDEYDRLVGAFIDRAYVGWTSGRYHATDLAWDTSGGRIEFSEEALTAYLAEAWRRNDYERAYGEMRRAGDLHPDALTLLSSPFLGNLDEIREQTAASDRERSRRVAELVAESDSNVFRDDELFLFMADRGDPEAYARLLQYASETNLSTVDTITAIGMLEDAVLSPHPDERASEIASRFVDGLVPMILGSIVRTDDRFFIQTTPGQIDMATAIVGAAALIALGEQKDDNALLQAGRNIVASALSLAGEHGMLPAAIIVRGQEFEPGEGLIGPEIVYPVLAENPNYPAHRALAAELEARVWAFTAVPVEVLVASESEWRFRLEYPRLRSHYLCFFGVPEFERMELFGQTWRDAPDFEVYSKGRHYDPESGTLMIKYYDDSVRRDIVLSF